MVNEIVCIWCTQGQVRRSPPLEGNEVTMALLISKCKFSHVWLKYWPWNWYHRLWHLTHLVRLIFIDHYLNSEIKYKWNCPYEETSSCMLSWSSIQTWCRRGQKKLNDNIIEVLFAFLSNNQWLRQGFELNPLFKLSIDVSKSLWLRLCLGEYPWLAATLQIRRLIGVWMMEVKRKNRWKGRRKYTL